jgi:hypothetical protein
VLRTTVLLTLRLNTAEDDNTAGTAQLETIHGFASLTLNLSDDVPPSRYHPTTPYQSNPHLHYRHKAQKILNNDNKVHDDEAGAIQIQKSALRVF